MLDTVLKHKGFFQRQIEEAINTLINEKNKENNKAFLVFRRLDDK